MWIRSRATVATGATSCRGAGDRSAAGPELSLPTIKALLNAVDPADRGRILADERSASRPAPRVCSERSTGSRSWQRRPRLQRRPPTTPPRPHAPIGRPRRTVDLPHPARGTHRAHPAPAPRPRPRDAPRARRRAVQQELGPARDRGPASAQDDELIDTAHASAWHWRQVGTVANTARGHWLLARVYAVLGHGDEAVYHARRANEVLEGGGEGIEDWDAAAAAEAMARALAVNGDPAGAPSGRRAPPMPSRASPRRRTARTSPRPGDDPRLGPPSGLLRAHRGRHGAGTGLGATHGIA